MVFLWWQCFRSFPAFFLNSSFRGFFLLEEEWTLQGLANSEAKKNNYKNAMKYEEMLIMMPPDWLFLSEITTYFKINLSTSETSFTGFCNSLAMLSWYLAKIQLLVNTFCSPRFTPKISKSISWLGLNDVLTSSTTSIWVLLKRRILDFTTHEHCSGGI